MAHPLRIQRLRTRGWRKPAGAFRVWLGGGHIYYLNLRDELLFLGLPEAKAKLATMREAILGNVQTLRGKPLLCWCGLEQDCHGDFLAELANGKGGG